MSYKLYKEANSASYGADIVYMNFAELKNWIIENKLTKEHFGFVWFDNSYNLLDEIVPIYVW